jgi:hypothetical protein
MLDQDKNEVLVGKDGFPVAAGGAESILDLIRPIGDELLEVQAQVQNGYKKPLHTPQDLILLLRSQTLAYYTLKEDALSSKIKADLRANNAGDISFLTEKDAHTKVEGTYWAIDPVVQFNQFLSGSDDWAISVGFVKDNVPTGGVVYYPAQRQAFFTCVDGDSYRRDLSVDGRVALFNLASGAEVGRVQLMSEFAQSATKKPDSIGAIAMTAICARVQPFDKAPK